MIQCNSDHYEVIRYIQQICLFNQITTWWQLLFFFFFSDLSINFHLRSRPWPISWGHASRCCAWGPGEVLGGGVGLANQGLQPSEGRKEDGTAKAYPCGNVALKWGRGSGTGLAVTGDGLPRELLRIHDLTYSCSTKEIFIVLSKTVLLMLRNFLCNDASMVV